MIIIILFYHLFVKNIFTKIFLFCLLKNTKLYDIIIKTRRDIMHLQESGEMYLETIYTLSNKLPQVRSVDISEEMGFSKPSVSRAIGLLKNGGFIKVEPNGFITLTDEGFKIAQKIYERHTLITEFLLKLGVNAETASNDACKIEHVISDESFEAIKRYALNK